MNIWDKRFMDLAVMIGTWTNCVRLDRQIGAVVARDDKILGMGYNKVPSPLQSCVERGECIRKKANVESGTRQEFCYSICAEQNAILQALKEGHDMKGATIYISHTPCGVCARWIIDVGIKRVVYRTPYTDKFSLEMLKEGGVKLEQYKE